MDYRSSIVASCWLAIAAISSVYMWLFADKIGDILFGILLPKGFPSHHLPKLAGKRLPAKFATLRELTGNKHEQNCDKHFINNLENQIGNLFVTNHLKSSAGRTSSSANLRR